MAPVRLSELRHMRDRLLTGTTGTYADLDAVRREVKYALQIFRGQGRWSVVDVTDKPIEEIASEILTLVRHM
jgi:regulator of PEP synthase PpsR (kinase-PPPase family)